MGRREYIAAAILLARKRIDLNQKELAKKAGISPTHMSRIERARCEPRQTSLDSIAAALGMTSSALLDSADALELNDRRRKATEAAYPVDPPRRHDEEVADGLFGVVYYDDTLKDDSSD